MVCQEACASWHTLFLCCLSRCGRQLCVGKIRPAGVKPLSRRYRSAAPLVGEPLAWRCVFDLRRNAVRSNLELRHKMTPMEKKLWYSFLRTYPVKMYKQRPIRTFVADFYCPLARLVIELDGSQHYTEQGMQYDKERSAVFEQYGVQVLRFRNQDVSAHFEMVCEQIHEAVVKRLEELERGKEG